MNMPSFYQTDLLGELAVHPGVDLRVHFARGVSAERLGLGWSAGTAGLPADVLHGSVARALAIARRERERVHVVGGLWSEPAFSAVLAYLRARGSRCVVYAEAFDPRVARSAWKRGLKNAFGRWIAGRAALLPVAGLGERLYAPLGFDPVYPFAYFRRAIVEPQRRRAGARVAFAGQLVERKGLDLLIRALAPLAPEFPDMTLTVIGDGPQREDLVRLAAGSPVVFAGVVPSGEMPARLAEMDLLVLPSRFDGWGLVVNEALMVGTPAIVSDQCGAAELIRSGENGWAFASEDVDALRARLRTFLSLSEADKLRLRAGAAASSRGVGVKEAADYLVECLGHLTGRRAAPPSPPWRLAAIRPPL
jgi:glycosyltransferase involved in cell wall biosynthesis